MADLSITASQVQPGTGAANTYTASGAITAGQPCYLSGTTAIAADADTSSTTAAARGIAVCSAADGQKVVVQSTGSVTLGAGAAPAKGTIYCVSDTAGGIKPSADLGSGDFVTILGVGNATNGIDLSINRSGIEIA